MQDRRAKFRSCHKVTKLATRVAATALLGLALPAAADYRVGAGATTFIAAGKLDLACTDLVVTGTLDLGSGAAFNIRDVIVQPGGTLVGGTSSIALSREFIVQPGGQYVAQDSRLQYDTACGPGRPSPIPTLGDAMLAALALLLAGLGGFVLRVQTRTAKFRTNGAMR